MAVGRNVWQHPDPVKISEMLRKVIFETEPLPTLTSSIPR